jgi:hypothetical protein
MNSGGAMSNGRAMNKADNNPRTVKGDQNNQGQAK